MKTLSIHVWGINRKRCLENYEGKNIDNSYGLYSRLLFQNDSPLQICVYSLQRDSLENIKTYVICRLRFGARALPMTTCHGMPWYWFPKRHEGHKTLLHVLFKEDYDIMKLYTPTHDTKQKLWNVIFLKAFTTYKHGNQKCLLAKDIA